MARSFWIAWRSRPKLEFSVGRVEHSLDRLPFTLLSDIDKEVP